TRVKTELHTPGSVSFSPGRQVLRRHQDFLRYARIQECFLSNPVQKWDTALLLFCSARQDPWHSPRPSACETCHVQLLSCYTRSYKRLRRSLLSVRSKYGFRRRMSSRGRHDTSGSTCPRAVPRQVPLRLMFQC